MQFHLAMMNGLPRLAIGASLGEFDHRHCRSFRQLKTHLRRSLQAAGAIIAIFTLTFAFSIRASAAISCAEVDTPKTRMIETRFGEIELTDVRAIQLYEDQNTIQAALELKGEAKRDALKSYFKQAEKSRADVALVYVNYAIAVDIGIRLAIDLAHKPIEALATAALIAPTLFISDMVSGFFHKFLDSYASEKNPIWGLPTRAFRKHHEFPANLNELSYNQNVASFGRLMAPLYVASMVAAPHMNPEMGSSLLLSLLLFSNGTELHRQAHLSKPSGWAKRLQDLRLILRKDDHVKHHKNPMDSDFGIVNGWSNPMMAKLWTKLDMAMWKATRRMPSNWIQNPRSIPESVLTELAADLSKIPQDLIVVASDPKHSTARIDELMSLWLDRHAALLSADGE